MRLGDGSVPAPSYTYLTDADWARRIHELERIAAEGDEERTHEERVRELVGGGEPGLPVRVEAGERAE